MPDLLTSLLQQGINLESSGPGDASSSFEANPAMQQKDKQANYEAMMHYLRTGQEPSQMTNPSYGPIGKFLQTIGATSKFKPVSEGLSDTMWGVGQAKKSEDEMDRERKLELMQKQGTEFGTPAARQLGETLGAPELESAFPKDLKGTGELRSSAQDITIQRLLQSGEEKDRQLGLQQQTAAVREAIAAGSMDRAQQLIGLGQQRTDISREKMENAPVERVFQAHLAGVNHDIDLATSNLDKLLADPLTAGGEDSPAAKRLQERIDMLEKRRIQLIEKSATAKKPADFGDVFTAPTTSQVKSKSGVKPPAAGLFD